MTHVVDVSVVSYVTAAVVVYYAFLYALGRWPHAAPERSDRGWPLLVIVIPARNEAQVIERTVQTALGCVYPGEKRVLVMDDASSDGTAVIADRLATRDERVRVCHRTPSAGGRGKSDVLNHAYRQLQAMLVADLAWLAGASADDICMCIVDADGHLSHTAAIDGVALLADPKVGAVQIGVQIRNARRSPLARLQDIEFVGFSFMVQTARDRLGSVGLGGNGQFTRLAALADLGDEPWRSNALTEDLDLGVRLQLAGWRLRFCASAWVAQEGLTRVRPLARQRTRWTQGHYQCWRYLPRILTARNLRMTQRIDSIAYLLMILLVVLVTAMAVIQILALAHVLQPTDTFLGWMGDGLSYRITIFVLSWLPVFLLLDTYQRFAQAPLARWELPAYCVFFAAYVYIWAVATARAWTRMILRRTSWTKTPRVTDAAGSTS
jgi:1,2-diacylglycerol 3-beta-glucosyltransferase